LPAARQVLHERARLVLRDHAQLVDAGVDEVRQHDVDDPVSTAERHRWLRPVACEGKEALPLAAGQDDPDDARTDRRGHRTADGYTARTGAGEGAAPTGVVD